MASHNDIANGSAPDAEFDALADLFLGERTPPRRIHNGTPAPPPIPHPTPAPRREPAASPSSAARRIDLVVQGHLPVRSGPWIARYAGQRAADLRAPVALIRLHEAHAMVDLIAPAPGQAHAAPPVHREPTIDRALRAAAAAASEAIIAVDAVEELGLADRDGVTSVTVLTGANEAAVVEAYRALKALGSRIAERPDSGEHIAIRIAVMGAEPDKAHAVRQKLADAARAFIGRDVELAAVAQRIEPTPAANLFRGDTDITPDALVAAVAAAPIEPPAPPRIERPAPPAEPVAAAPRIEHKIEPITPELPDPVALIPGLTAIRLPSAPDRDTRIARDADGRIHLIRLDTATPEAAVAALLAVESWMRDNAELIEMALGAPVGQPALHLLTERAAAVRPLLTTRIRVHAVARATGPFAAVTLN